METKNIEDLKANPKNPRTINKHDYDALVASLKEFGDLSGIVFNTTTGQLVGGHQRTGAFKKMGGERRIVITHRFAEPNRQGTVAIGFVDYDNEQFSYREVQWDANKEKAANIAANRIQGQFDLDLLAEVTTEISQLENSADLLKLTGQREDEISRLLKMSGVAEPAEDEEPDPDFGGKLEFAVTAEQREIVEEALGHIKATTDLHSTKSASQNGTALFIMCRDYLTELHGQNEVNAPQQQ